MIAAPSFEADELENSFPFDAGRRVRFAEHHGLLRHLLAGMMAEESRKRARRASAAQRFSDTVNALLANLIAAALNKADPDRFVAVTFNRNDHVGTSICCDTLRRCRDHLSRHKLIDTVSGFNRLDADGVGNFGRTTRLRPSSALRSMIDDLAQDEKKLTRPSEDLIRLNSPTSGAGPIPNDIERGRLLVEAVNRRLADAHIELAEPMSYPTVLRTIDDEGEDDSDAKRKRRYAGDTTAVALYRVFKGDWDSGGRLYGGWWMSLSRRLRPYLCIDGAPTVELDYASLHPRLLFARAGVPLDFDPYIVSIGTRSPSRDLGKRTFNRLLNRRANSRTRRLTLRAAPGDPALLPPGVTFRSYLSLLLRPLAPIQPMFGTGEGVRLQKEDSELAMAVIAAMENKGITVLPVHDSFIVTEDNQDILRTAMIDAFVSRHHAIPEIVSRGPAPPLAPFSPQPGP